MRQQLLAHELLGNRSVVDPHRIAVEELLGGAAQVLHETDVDDHDELVVTVIRFRAQRQTGSRGRAHAVHHAGPLQQLHRRAQIARPAVRVDLRIHELAPGQAGGVQDLPVKEMVTGARAYLPKSSRNVWVTAV